MELKLFRPDGYSLRAHRIEATLTEAERKAYAVWPISFQLPEMPKRMLHTPVNFVVAASTESGTALRGIFVEGKWEADVYSNGVAEEENPTPIREFEKKLRDSICASVKLAVDAYADMKKWNPDA